jgi:hypothetical protein
VWHDFTPNAVRALARARDEAAVRRQETVEPEHLLLGLLLRGDCAAGFVLSEAGAPPTWVRWRVEEVLGPCCQVPESSPEASAAVFRVVEAAREEAAALGDEQAGSEHLLLALARGGDRAAALLAACGVRYDDLLRHVRRLGGYRDAAGTDGQQRAPLDQVLGPRPLAVGAAIFVLALLGLYGLWHLWFFRVSQSPGHPAFNLGLQLAAAAQWWGVLCALGLPPALLFRGRWAWAGTIAHLSVSGLTLIAAATACLAYLFSSGDDGGFSGIANVLSLFAAGFCGLVAALLFGTAAALFRARHWFGIEPGRGWRTLLRRGAWAFVIATILHAGGLLSPQFIAAP